MNEIIEDFEETDDVIFLYQLSINNKYHEIMKRIENETLNSENAYYYSLIKYKQCLNRRCKSVEKSDLTKLLSTTYKSRML